MGIDLTSLDGTCSNLTVDSNNTADYSQSARGIIADLANAWVLTPIYEITETPKILAFGDSITSGEYPTEPTPGAYRLQLSNNFGSYNLNVDFIGSQVNQGTNLDDAEHEGHPGWTINELTTLLDEGELTSYQPDIVLLMAGTNDILKSSDDASQVIDDLNHSIDRLQEEFPDAQILVSSLTPLDSSIKSEQLANTVEEVNALLPELAAEQGQQVTYVNAGGSIAPRDLVADGIHPNEEGYQKIGNAWFDAIIERDALTGVDHITGTVYSDRLTGNDQANILLGNGGADILTGGHGADSFVYENLDLEVDTITDFSADDRILISASVFDAGLIPGTKLTPYDSETGVFISSNNPYSLGTGAYFLYDTDDGRLSFDRDGTGSGTAVDIALLSNMPETFSNEHIQIIA